MAFSYWRTGTYPANQGAQGTIRNNGFDGYGNYALPSGRWGREGWNKWAWSSSCLKGPYDPNLVQNGTFDAGIENWTPTGSGVISWSAGQLKLNSPTPGAFANQNVFGFVVGQVYRVRANITPGASGRASLILGPVTWEYAFSGGGNVDAFFTATTTGYTLQLKAGDAAAWATDGEDIFYDNIVVVPIAGIGADVGSYVITGTPTGLKYGRNLPITPGSYSISGQVTGLSRTRQLSAVPGSYSVSGVATSLAVARKLVGAVGSYALTGSQVALRRGFSLSATPGAYSLTGVATGLRAARKLSEAVGSYSLTGTATALRVARKLAEAVGSYAITGTITVLRTTRSLPAVQGSYSLGGTAAQLKGGRNLVAATGSYGYTGSAVGLTYTSSGAGLAVGAYSLTGSTVSLRVARKLLAASGLYRLTGREATLLYNSIWPVTDHPSPVFADSETIEATWAPFTPSSPGYSTTEPTPSTWTEQTPGTGTWT